jgi:hypothetical protein
VKARAIVDLDQSLPHCGTILAGFIMVV